MGKLSKSNPSTLLGISPEQRRRAKKSDYFVHDSSYVDAGVKIGQGTQVWHFCHILKGSRIGKNCKIGQNVVIGPDVKIGNNVKIQNNVSVYKGITLEDDVFCGPSCVFTNVHNPRSAIPRMDKIRHTVVRKGATIGANATIICGNNIGGYAFIGAGAVVTKGVPHYGLAVGVPASLVGYMCECGLKLDFNQELSSCKTCNRKYTNKNGIIRKVV